MRTWESELSKRVRALEKENKRLRAALAELVDAFRNPGDGDVFEAGEVPALDRARALLAA